MDLRTDIAVSGSTRGEEEHRIFLLHRIEVENFLEELVGIAEALAELVLQVFADFVAADVDTRPDRRQQVLWIAAVMHAHHADALLDDAREGPAPAGMKCADRFV